MKFFAVIPKADFNVIPLPRIIEIDSLAPVMLEFM